MTENNTGTIDTIPFFNKVQNIILINTLEESGLWDVVTEVRQNFDGSRLSAFNRIKGEIDYIVTTHDIYLIFSTGLYDTATSKVLDKRELLNLTLDDVEFKEDGPFYYFSSVPEI